MTVIWTEHRFAGGALALDVANTVVLRGVPEKTFDRFDNADELPRFVEAANRFRVAELGSQKLAVTDAKQTRKCVLAVREATDRLFRGMVESGEIPPAELPSFLRACADSLERSTGNVRGVEEGSGTVPLETATALSALSLLAPEKAYRIRICDNCGWLFLDRSRNGSRRWCDMTVCGNRQKAKRHYSRRVKTMHGEAP